MYSRHYTKYEILKLLSKNLTGRDHLIHLGIVWKVVSKQILRQECVDWIKISYAEFCGELL
jgi:hypothetical protein